jgi:hypothetical protein
MPVPEKFAQSAQKLASKRPQMDTRLLWDILEQKKKSKGLPGLPAPTTAPQASAPQAPPAAPMQPAAPAVDLPTALRAAAVYGPLGARPGPGIIGAAHLQGITELPPGLDGGVPVGVEFAKLPLEAQEMLLDLIEQRRAAAAPPAQ